jgi:hypothetical protein
MATDIILTTTQSSQKCDFKQKSDEKHGIDFWPSVEIGKVSAVPCPQGTGFAKWKCMDNGLFDDNGPDWSECNDWLNKIPDIRNLNNAMKVSEIISNNTQMNNSVVDSSTLNRILDTMKNLQNFFHNEKEVDFKNAKIYSSQTIGIFSNLIDQKHAWINSTNDEKIKTASKILEYIQYSSFTLVLQQNSTNYVEKIRNKNIYLETFISNPKEKISFPTEISEKRCSIDIPEDENKVQNNTAIGAIIDKIQDYLLGGDIEHKKINSVILAFSLSNRTESVKLIKEAKIR